MSDGSRERGGLGKREGSAEEYFAHVDVLYAEQEAECGIKTKM